jgi:endonuclease/exonuclease/phosphatase family metal-dependent hydrolase
MVALLAVFGAVPAQAAPPAVRVLTYNACGNVCRLGEYELTTRNIAYQIQTRKASVTMIQELCFTQFLRLRSRLAAYGYSAVFGAATTGKHCANDAQGHGKGFGVAIVARGAMAGQIVRQLPTPYAAEPEGRVALGVTVRLPGRTVFVVTTHTAPRGRNLGAQMTALRHWLGPIAAVRPVLFGGDLNSLPRSTQMDGFYQAFHEADDRMNPRPTFAQSNRKIDYLFASRSHFTARGAATTCTGYSDHCLYFGLFK